MADDQRQRRAALDAFLTAHRGAPWRLNPLKWAKASGRSESMIRNFLAGRNEGLNDASYTDLARGASEILHRTVTTAELRGERPPGDVPVSSYVGAGAEVFPFKADDPIDHVPAPPGFTGEAMIVTGDSGLPAYEGGDVLYVASPTKTVTALLGRVVVVQVADDGPRLLKRLLKGSRKNRYDLQSINLDYARIEDQPIEWVATIEWVRKRR